jgi:LEA14-like dessication related protein
MILYVALGALLAMLGGITWYASLDNPKLEQVEIDMGTVKLISENTIEGKAKLDVGFVIKNPSDKTFTISRIDYELFANGVSIGKSQYSTEDVAMPGRAAFYPGAEIELPSSFTLTKTTENADQYTAITTESPVVYSAKGLIVVESAWSLVEKEFNISQ